MNQLIFFFTLCLFFTTSVFAGGSGYEPGNTNFKNLMKCQVKNEKDLSKKWVTIRQAVFNGQYSGDESWQEILIGHTPENDAEKEYEKYWKVFKADDLFIGSEPLNGADSSDLELTYSNDEISVTGVSYDSYVKVDLVANENGGQLKAYRCGDDYEYKKCKTKAFVDLQFSRCIASI